MDFPAALPGVFLPTLFRLLVTVGIICGIAYGAMLALVTFVHPVQREILQTVPLPKPASR